MSTIVLTAAQSQLVLDAEGPLEVLDANGHPVGTLIRQEPNDEPIEISREEAEELIRRMSTKDIQWRTTEEVLAYLNGLAPQ